MASLPASALSTDSTHPDAIPHAVTATHIPITVLIVVPTLDGGAADAGAIELVRILSEAGHHAIVVSRAGRLVADVTAAGGEFVPLDVSSNNPAVILRSAFLLTRLARERRCMAIHALGRVGGLERVYRCASLQPSVRDQLVQGIPRTEYLQATLQQHHGARRPCHRVE